MKKRSLAFLTLFLTFLLVLTLGCVSSERPQSSSYTKVYQTPATTMPKTPSILKLSLGETATTSDYAITVFSATRASQYRYYSDILKEYNVEVAEPGKSFLLVDAEIRYTGSQSAYVGATDFSLEDSEGVRYDPEILYYGTDGMDYFKELYSNQKIKGKILFIIPKYASGLKIYYNFGSLWTGTNLVYWDVQSESRALPSTVSPVTAQMACGGRSFSSVLSLGQKFKYNDLQNANALSVSVNSFRTGDHYTEVKKDYTGKEFTEQVTAMPGYQFVFVNVEVTNTGHIGTTGSFYTPSPYSSDFIFFCDSPYSNKYLDVPGKIQYYQYSNILYTYKLLNRYESSSGVIVFEIPASITPENGYVLVELWDPLEPVWRLG